MSAFKQCAQDDCGKQFRAHKWGSIRAHEEGWLEQKDGTVWCPEHLPAWVEEWRKKEATK